MQEYNTATQSIDRMQPFGFTGYERDVVSGLYYAQARRYDAETGRFTSRDMIKGNISQMQSQNEYAYCLGNPLMYVDRDGREPQFVSGEGYKQIGYDEDGTPIIQKEDEDTKDKKIQDDVEILGYTGYVVDGVDLINETGNLIVPEVIKQQPKPPNIGKGVWNKKIATDIANQQKIYSATQGVTKWIGPAITVYDTGKGIKENMEAGTSIEKTFSDADVDISFYLLSVLTSMAAGALVGSEINLGAGTIAGIIVGLIYGIALDSKKDEYKERRWEELKDRYNLKD